MKSLPDVYKRQIKHFLLPSHIVGRDYDHVKNRLEVIQRCAADPHTVCLLYTSQHSVKNRWASLLLGIVYIIVALWLMFAPLSSYVALSLSLIHI